MLPSFKKSLLISEYLISELKNFKISKTYMNRSDEPLPPAKYETVIKFSNASRK